MPRYTQVKRVTFSIINIVFFFFLNQHVHRWGSALNLFHVEHIFPSPFFFQLSSCFFEWEINIQTMERVYI